MEVKNKTIKTLEKIIHDLDKRLTLCETMLCETQRNRQWEITKETQKRELEIWLHETESRLKEEMQTTAEGFADWLSEHTQACKDQMR